MTRQESFKRRVRTRMARTGERYGAARRALIDQARTAVGAMQDPPTRPRQAQPETSDASVRAATGLGWDEWCALIESWEGRDGGHTAVAAHLRDAHGVDSWWSQAITVGWERITGRRAAHQRPDGTFTAGRSRTLSIDPDDLRRRLLDDRCRNEMFGQVPTELRSGPSARTLRLGIGDTVALVSIEARGAGRARVSVAHEKLRSHEDVQHWKQWWGHWLDDLAPR